MQYSFICSLVIPACSPNLEHISILIEKINDLRFADFWEDDSPIWARPQARHFEVPTQLDGILQVVGHTPMKENTLESSVLSVDVFSTSWGKKFGSEKMIIVDTETAEFDEI